MKRVILLILMLRVWWDPCGGCDLLNGIEIGATGEYNAAYILVRLDIGKIEKAYYKDVTNSKWEEVKP